VNSLDDFCQFSAQLPGWIRGAEAEDLAISAFGLPADAVIVQIGTFLGSAAILLAGARKLRGIGKVHCVDPFDCSGDAFSVPFYERILAEAGGGPLRARFEQNIRLAKLEAWIEVHQGRAEDVASGWSTPLDMLALSGDQSPVGARAAYEEWSPFLKRGAVIAVHNSSPRDYQPTHDGNRRIVVEEIVPPLYCDIRRTVHTTFALRAATP
jgi:hypothetical protein